MQNIYVCTNLCHFISSIGLYLLYSTVGFNLCSRNEKSMPNELHEIHGLPWTQNSCNSKNSLLLFFPDFGRIPSYNLMLIDNGWYLILENITCGYGNHAWYIEFISLVACGHSWYKFNISLVITITMRDIFQYQIPAIIYLPIRTKLGCL